MKRVAEIWRKVMAAAGTNSGGTETAARIAMGFKLRTALTDGGPQVHEAIARAVAGRRVLSEPSRNQQRLGKLEHHYATVPCVYSVDASAHDVEAYVAAGEWDRVKWLAGNAHAPEVKMFAIESLISAKRYYEAMNTVESYHGSEARQMRAQLGLVFERDIDGILSGHHTIPENCSAVHLMSFILRETSSLEIARKVLGWMSGNMSLNYAPAPWCTKSDVVVELIVETLERNKLWRSLQENMAEIAFNEAMPGRWRCAVSALERNVGVIEDPRVLLYIGRFTNSVHVARTAVDRLKRNVQWEAIEQIAAATETTIVMRSPAPFGIGSMSKSTTVERENAQDIADYAAKAIRERLH